MVLVTGASGFIGKHLVRELSTRGLPVRALYHSRPPMGELASLPGVEWVQCDLLDIFSLQSAMTGMTDIYHCAGIVSFDPARRDEMLHFNRESTANIVNLSLDSNIRKLVHVSSVSALGRSGADDKEINEDTEWSESSYFTAYGISKYLAEMEVWRGIGEGLDAVIVNPGIVLGNAGQDDAAAQLVKLVYKGFPFYTRGVTSWVVINDLVNAMVSLMDSGISAERFIISGSSQGYREVCNMIAGALGRKAPAIYANSLLTGLVWRVGALKRSVFRSAPLITRETAANARIRSFYNNSKLLQALPDFAYTPINTAVNEMARSFLNSLKK